MKTKRKYDKHAAHQAYKLPDGTKLPGVTTILGVLSKPALVSWANQEGLEGRDIAKVSRTALDVGSCFHFMAECYAMGVEPDLDGFCKDDIDRAESAFIKFLDFWNDNGLTPIATEIQLASSEFRFGGTSDLVAMDKDGRVVLADYKTSKRVYAENRMQLAALEFLWNHADIQMVDGDPVPRGCPVAAVERRLIVRVGKEDVGDFDVCEVSEAEALDRWDEFLACLALYNIHNTNKRKWK